MRGREEQSGSRGGVLSWEEVQGREESLVTGVQSPATWWRETSCTRDVGKAGRGTGLGGEEENSFKQHLPGPEKPKMDNLPLCGARCLGTVLFQC